MIDAPITSKPNPPSVLFTNLFIMTRTGSELHLLEMARAFIDKGWRVSIYSLVVGFPMQGEFEKMDVKLVRFGEEDQLDEKYDLLFAQHHLVSDYLWVSTGIQFKKVIVSILGIGDMEGLPCFYEEADAVVFISEEAKEHNAGMNIEDGSSFVFPNYATKEFFQMGEKSLGKNTLTNIAVISNHIPNELEELEGCSSDISVDFFGYERGAAEITPDLLKQYDLIISIGRTVQACFACGVPVYCYDHFGGPGYIDPSDIELHAHYNFSGRSLPHKKTANELWLDICENYLLAQDRISHLRDIAVEKWNFDSLFNDFYDDVVFGRETKERKSCDFDDTIVFKYQVLCLLYQKEIMNRTCVAQLFWSNEDSFLTQGNSETIRCALNSWISSKDAFVVPEGYTPKRFDPDSAPCKVAIKKLYSNAYYDRSESRLDFEFVNNDPQINLIELSLEDLTFEFCVSKIEANTVFEIFEQRVGELNAELNESRAEVNSVSEQLVIAKEDFREKSLSIRYLIKQIPKAFKNRLFKN